METKAKIKIRKHVYIKNKEKQKQAVHYVNQRSQPTADLVVTVTPTSTDSSHMTQCAVAMVIPVVVDPLVKQVQLNINCHHWEKTKSATSH